ncbi:MAG: hypothetical protein ABSA70_03420 [Terriglobia bacterium]
MRKANDFTQAGRLWMQAAAGIALALALGCGGSVSQPSPSSPGSGSSSRDPLTWPFASNSIWNQPVGSGAVYVDAGFVAAANVTVDEDWWIVTSSADPVTNVYNPYQWGQRCGSGTPWNSTTHFPSALIVPDAQPPDTPNYASAILEPDGRTIQQYEPTARCAAGGPLYGYQADTVDLFGDGTHGGHFGSGLSSIGGTIRVGELRPSAGAIHHALKLEAWAQTYYYYSASRPGYRWPADRADDYAPAQYHGTNPALTEGSLLAIPRSVSISTLGLETDAARKIAQALQDYGGYIVDDTAWDDFQFATEVNPSDSVRKQFLADYGYQIDAGNGTPFFRDINIIYEALKVIDNNGPDRVGGGGTPLVPPAPPLTP